MKSLLVYIKILKGFMVDLPTPVNINYLFGFGVSLGMVYSVQIISGFVLSWFFWVGNDGSFWSVVGIMQDISYGWLVRFTHSSGVTLFFILLYLHTFRGLLYGGFTNGPVWLSGLVVLLIVMAASFLGYVLPWGSMSYWGMTVVTSMFSAIPLVGGILTEWIWGGGTAGVNTLVRFFSLHYMLSLVVMVLVVFHMLELHVKGSSNPLGVSSTLDKVIFHEVITYKDLVGLVLLLFLYWVVVFVIPYSLMDAANFEEVSYVSTPKHIKPEWYFLFVYCILRSTPNKLGGVVLMLGAILILCLFAFGGQSSVYRKVGGFYWKGILAFWAVSFCILTWLGGMPVEYPYEVLGQSFTILYFLLIILLLGLSCSVAIM
uniref:Cytochrome b n=1 Tax=Echinorhynchus truttae TaxID=185727 RepID=K3W3Y0_9BILA|nr:cytochrome b [Echinorhynchus truttae]CCA94465.1 cytochrome b [Echinorhynchus truttae]